MIGERNREVRGFLVNELGPEGRKRSVVVCATSERPAPLRVRACFVSLAIAEYFRDQGANVLLVMDSVTRPRWPNGRLVWQPGASSNT